MRGFGGPGPGGVVWEDGGVEAGAVLGLEGRREGAHGEGELGLPAAQRGRLSVGVVEGAGPALGVVVRRREGGDGVVVVEEALRVRDEVRQPPAPSANLHPSSTLHIFVPGLMKRHRS